MSNSSGVTTVNVGSTAPILNGILYNIHGTVTVAGSGGDILNVDDSGGNVAKMGVLSGSTITGLGMGGITYTGVSAVNIGLGSVGNTLLCTHPSCIGLNGFECESSFPFSRTVTRWL